MKYSNPLSVKMLMRLLTFLFAFGLPIVIYGQKKYTVEYEPAMLKPFIKHPQTKFRDSSAAMVYLGDLQSSAISKGYLLASVDSIEFKRSGAHVFFHLGQRFTGCHLTMPNEELRFVRKHERINEKLISNVSFTPREVESTLRKIHRAYLNNGYPFAAVRLTGAEITEDAMQAEISVDRGEYYEWSAIHIKGDSSVSVKFISNLIGIRKEQAYDESKLKDIASRVQQVPFIEEIKPHELLFTKEGCELYLYIKSIPISSFNGVVGLQPDPVSKKMTVTGELNLKLLNVLKRGELLDIRWQSIRDQTQSLTSHLNYPFLFNTSFGIDGSFDLYKRDTTFLELNSNIGVQYFLNKGNYLKAYYQNISSSILSGGANNPSFNNLSNVESHNYGLSYVSQKVDYLPNPSRGVNIQVTASTGKRKSQSSDSSLVIESLTFRGMSSVEWFIPLHKRHVLRLSNVTEFYSADEIFQNEVYRFGGLTAQRGFNEDELFATTRSTSTVEYRFLLDRNSHIFAFFDQTWYENNTSGYYNDSPIGFGAGLSFRTNLGVFSISYALGKQLDNQILLSNGKVHFGYIAYF